MLVILGYIATISVLLSIPMFLIGIIVLIVKAIRHKDKKIAKNILLLSVICFIVGLVVIGFIPEDEIPKYEPDTSTSTSTGAVSTADIETFVAKYCMTYMDYLKNPYSFEVKSAWGYAREDGKFDVWVRFTAENSLGGTKTDVISSTGIDKSTLANFYPEIHIWGDEPANKALGKGQTLNANNIQKYIDNNY